MRALRRFSSRVRATFLGGQRDIELASELEAHRQLLVEGYVRAGMSPNEARRAAALKLGNPSVVSENWRDQHVLPVLDSLLRELRMAVRGLARRPSFTAACALILSLAIGATTAVFSLIDRVIFHPLDVPDPSHLVTIEYVSELRGERRGGTSMPWRLAEPVLEMTAFDRVALSSAGSDRGARDMLVSGDGVRTELVTGRFVTANYFDVLGLRPALGRDFQAADDAAAAPAVVMLGHAYWLDRLGGDPNVVGRSVRVNGSPADIVGVAPRGFTGTELGVPAPDLYLPLMTASRLATSDGTQTDGRGLFTTGRPTFEVSPVSPLAAFDAIGRIGPDSDQRAREEVASILGSTSRAVGNVVPVSTTMLPFATRVETRQFLWLLAGAVGLTMLIGCANLAGLLLARAEERRSELAVRAALGAGRARLMREQAAEAAILAAAGGAAALLVAAWMSRAFSVFVLPGGVSLASLRGGFDARTLVFASMATAVAAVLIGAAPAARAASRRLGIDVRRQSSGSTRMGVTRALVGVQVAVCVMLVFGAVLFVRTLANALSTDLGFDGRGLFSAEINVPLEFRSPVATARGGVEILAGLDAVDALVERVRSIPGVTAATVGPLPLLRGVDRTVDGVRIDREPRELDVPLEIVYVATDYFTTLGQPLVRGRDFDERDRVPAHEAPGVAIVNETAARRFWPEADPLQGTISGGDTVSNPDLMVVGVSRDTRLRSIRNSTGPVVYLPRLQHQSYLAGYLAASGTGFLIVRTPGNPLAMTQTLTRVAEDVGLSLRNVTTLDQRTAEILMPQRLGRALLLALGAIALSLTIVGIYGLVSYLVTRDTKAIGVRVALGAGASQIVRSSSITTLLPVVTGTIVGIVLAWFGGRYTDRFMYGMSGSDPVALAVTSAAILVAAALAALLPTRRALRIDPVQTLRTD